MTGLYSLHIHGRRYIVSRSRNVRLAVNEKVLGFSSIAPKKNIEDEVLMQNQGLSLPLHSFEVQLSTSSKSVDFATLKCGSGNIVATGTPASGSQPSTTQLSTISHKAPVRLIPTTSSTSNIAKQISIGQYGGGMTQGDSATINVCVENHARLHVRTQGINRVYGHGNRQPYRLRGHETIHGDAGASTISKNVVDAVVHENGLLIYAPDPVSLHSGARYEQQANFLLKDPQTSSLVAVDWICSGRRYSEENEYWNHKSCTTRTTLRFASEQQDQNDIPALIDSQSISVEAMDAFTANNQQFHAVVTVMLSGSLVVNDLDDGNDSVVKRFLQLQSAFMAPFTAVRTTNIHESNDQSSMSANAQELINEQLSVGGRVVLGVTKSTDSNNCRKIDLPIYTVRIAATSNEDIYRILHFCLLPVSSHLNGIECYKDRIVTGSKSPSSNSHPLPTTSKPTTIASETDTSPFPTTDQMSHNFWTAYMLADSALPIGSFAHSSGIEVAEQLGFLQAKEQDIQNESTASNCDDAVAAFIRVAVTSTIRQATPFIWYSSHITHDLSNFLSGAQNVQNDLDMISREYLMLDAYTNAMLATNGPSCRASLDQGRNLLRVAQSVLNNPSEPSTSIKYGHSFRILSLLEKAVESLDGGHLTTVLGVVSHVLELNEHDAVRLYGYCVARDIVNAAVRLNLVGPLAGQKILLHHAQPAVLDAIRQSERAIQQVTLPDQLKLNTSMTPASEINDYAVLRGAFLASLTCVPILETIHPCHDVLATRLFRS